MALCNKEWEPLVVGNDTTVTLDKLVVLHYLISVHAMNSHDGEKQFHDAMHPSSLKQPAICRRRKCYS